MRLLRSFFRWRRSAPRNLNNNAIFLNTVIMNSDEIFLVLREEGNQVDNQFRANMKNLFTDAEGAQIHEAIDELYRNLLKFPGSCNLAQALMAAAQRAEVANSMANEDEMLNLRNLWLRRLREGEGEGEGEERSEIEDSGKGTGQGFISMPVFFATDREMKDSKEKGKKIMWGTGRGSEVTWGVKWISLPDTLRYGETDSRTWHYSPKRRGVAQNKIVQLTTIPLLEHKCLGNLKGVMEAMGEREAIVFVHGYNSTLRNACQRMAQVAYTANFHGPSFVFSWPSTESVAGYTADEGNVMWAVKHFMETLKILITELGVERVHLLGHSMGSRLILYSLLRMDIATWQGPGVAKIGRVVLAAPDFDMGEFVSISSDVALRCERITLYCSGDDQALHLSRSVHGGYPRLGDFRGFLELATHPAMLKLENLDAIDTTGTDNTFFRHAYVFETCGIIADCCLVLRTGLPPPQRKNLVLARLPGGHIYWTLDTNFKASSLKYLTEQLGLSGVRITKISISSSSPSGKLLTQTSSFETQISSIQNNSVDETAEDEGESGKVGEVENSFENIAGNNGENNVESNVENSFIENSFFENSKKESLLKLRKSAGKRFMDEFAFDLKGNSVGGTLDVSEENASEIGGSDLVLPADIEMMPSFDFNRNQIKKPEFLRSKSFMASGKKKDTFRSKSFASMRTKRSYLGLSGHKEEDDEEVKKFSSETEKQDFDAKTV